jgi:hypothetical protein
MWKLMQIIHSSDTAFIYTLCSRLYYNWRIIFDVHRSVCCKSVSIIVQKDATMYSLSYFCKLLFMFRVVTPPIIRSTYNCNYSIWHWSDFGKCSVWSQLKMRGMDPTVFATFRDRMIAEGIIIKYRFRPVTVIQWFDAFARLLVHFIVACVITTVQGSSNMGSCPVDTNVLYVWKKEKRGGGKNAFSKPLFSA